MLDPAINPQQIDDAPQPVSLNAPPEVRNGDTHIVDLRVLTVKQPWADEILYGSKWCENRIWSTNYRGPLYVHAGSTWFSGCEKMSAGSGEMSAIIGRVELVDVVDMQATDRAALRRLAQKYGLPTDRDAMWHVGDDFVWIFTRRAALAKPIHCKGVLKIWHKRVPASQLDFLATVDFDGKQWMPAVEIENPDADLPAPTERRAPSVTAAPSRTPKVAVRPVAANRENGHAARSIDATERDEVMSAIREVFSSGGVRDRRQAITEISAALGYGRTGSRIAHALDTDLRAAVRRGILDNSGEGLALLCRSITDYSRDFLIEQLQAGMGTRWFEREDLIEQTARWLGFRRTGPVIRATLKSVINGAIRRSLLESDGPRVRRVR